MSPSKQYGATDLGQDGIDNFFYYHRCSQYCHSSWSRSPTARPLFQVCEGTSMSSGGQLLYGSSAVASGQHVSKSTQLRAVKEDEDRPNPMAVLAWALIVLFVLLSMSGS